MPKQRNAQRSVLSLERKLPVLIGGLVTVSLVATLMLVQWELRSSAIDAAADRLSLVGDRLGTAVSGLIAQRTARYADVARSQAVISYLTAEQNDVGGVRSVLESLRQQPDGNLPIQLRSASGRVIAATGDSPVDRGETPASAGPPRGEEIIFSRLTPAESGYTYWVSVPVRYGGSIIGHITQQRGGGANGVGRLEELLGSGMELYIANAGGGDWAAFDGTMLTGVPTVPQLERPFTFRQDDGTDHFAYAKAVAGTPWLLVTRIPMAGVTARMDAVLKRIAMTGLVLLAFGLIAAWVVSRSVTKPLGVLGGVADAIAQGDYSQRAQFERGDEIGRLARSFDAMASRVDGTHRELQRRFREAQSLAAELELANARLHAAIRDAETARTDAQQASRAKSEFLATMSHEIRTPINAIIGYTDLMDLRIAGGLTDQQQNYVERIRLSSEHLISVVNDVLDFAKIESGQMRIAREVRSAYATINDAVSMLQGRATARNIAVTVDAPADAAFLGDAHRVQQILLNLLSNALKFTPEGGSVVIECENRESRGFGAGVEADARTSWTCISVRDDGVGIAPDQITPIFEPFVQGASGYTRPHGGTGLGLAISRSLARMMEGDLTVESEVGVGSTFTVWLPHPSSAAAIAS